MFYHCTTEGQLYECCRSADLTPSVRSAALMEVWRLRVFLASSEHWITSFTLSQLSTLTTSPKPLLSCMMSCPRNIRITNKQTDKRAVSHNLVRDWDTKLLRTTRSCTVATSVNYYNRYYYYYYYTGSYLDNDDDTNNNNNNKRLSTAWEFVSRLLSDNSWHQNTDSDVRYIIIRHTPHSTLYTSKHSSVHYSHSRVDQLSTTTTTTTTKVNDYIDCLQSDTQWDSAQLSWYTHWRLNTILIVTLGCVRYIIYTVKIINQPITTRRRRKHRPVVSVNNNKHTHIWCGASQTYRVRQKIYVYKRYTMNLNRRRGDTFYWRTVYISTSKTSFTRLLHDVVSCLHWHHSALPAGPLRGVF